MNTICEQRDFPSNSSSLFLLLLLKASFHNTRNSLPRKSLSGVNHRPSNSKARTRWGHMPFSKTLPVYPIHKLSVSYFFPWPLWLGKYSFVFTQTQTILQASFKNLKILLIWCLNCYWEEETGVPLFPKRPQASKKWPTELEFASQVAGSQLCAHWDFSVTYSQTLKEAEKEHKVE